MELVHAHTDIPIPHVRRVITYDHCEGDILIVMKFIPNARELKACWSTLSLWKQLGIILAMRYYIRQLRRVRHPSSGTPGPPGTRPSMCYGLQFGYDPEGPFKTTDALACYFHRLHGIAQYRHNNKFIPLPPLNKSLFSRLVFTHNDLNMRNILLDSDGRLWVIDWGFAGFFPPCFEYLAMLYTARNEKAPKGWHSAIKFMAEPSFERDGCQQSVVTTSAHEIHFGMLSCIYAAYIGTRTVSGIPFIRRSRVVVRFTKEDLTYWTSRSGPKIRGEDSSSLGARKGKPISWFL